ncbi:MAG: hypothetical protein ACR2N2_06660 [Acidimicrobiia bacterium]
MDTQPEAESDGYEFEDHIEADHVTITQGGAALIEATTVEITQGGVQAAETKELSISQGGAMVIDTQSADLTMSGAGVLNADTVQMNSAGAGVAIADTLKADENSTIGMLFAGTIEGGPDVKVDMRTAAAFGAAFAVTLFILKRLIGRR